MRFNKKHVSLPIMRTLISFLLLIGTSFFLHAEDLSPLKVGMELSYPPFETVTENGQPTGMSVDLAYALGSYLKRPIEIYNISFVGLIPSLNSEKIDLILSSFTITKKRREAVDFSIPYASNGLCLLVNKDSRIQSIHDANAPDIRIAVKLGTSGESYAEAHLSEADIKVFSHEGLCVLEVAQGKADIFLYDQLSVFKAWQKNLQTTRAILQPFEEQPWGIAVKKGDNQLLEQINVFLTSFRMEGGFIKLTEKYLHPEKAAFDKLGIPFM